MPKPFLKWVGGKGQLLPELMDRVDKAGEFGRYHEPFVGGGALFFALWRSGALTQKAFLSDNNDNLMQAYRGVKGNVADVIALLHEHKQSHGKDYYYQVRASIPGTLAEQAARIIYLNRTCFNGLFRENSKGLFNVPMGKYKNPKICDEQNLRMVATALKNARLETRPFESVLDHAEPGDFVYFDPPYHPVSKTASFTAYDKGGFGEDEQRRLAEVFMELTSRGVKTLLSNSMTDFITSLYKGKGIRVETVYATRKVNSKGDGRGRVPEALVRNF